MMDRRPPTPIQQTVLSTFPTSSHCLAFERPPDGFVVTVLFLFCFCQNFTIEVPGF